MRRYKRSMGLIFLASTLVIFLIASACAPMEAEKISEARVGLHAAFTGPMADATSPAGKGVIDPAKYVNEYLGGIDGVKVKVLWEEILKRFERIEIAGDVERSVSTFVHGYTALPVIVHPRKA